MCQAIETHRSERVKERSRHERVNVDICQLRVFVWVWFGVTQLGVPTPGIWY